MLNIICLFLAIKGNCCKNGLILLKTGASDTVGFDKVIKVVNHLSTDGEAKNTGQYNGLWKLLDDEREKLDVTFPPPQIYLCCTFNCKRV